MRIDELQRGLASARDEQVAADPLAGRLPISVGTTAGSAGDSRQLHLAKAKPRVIEAAGMRGLKKRPIRLIKNHPHADHAGAETVCRGGEWGWHDYHL